MEDGGRRKGGEGGCLGRAKLEKQTKEKRGKSRSSEAVTCCDERQRQEIRGELCNCG